MVEKASFSKEFRSEFHSGGRGKDLLFFLPWVSKPNLSSNYQTKLMPVIRQLVDLIFPRTLITGGGTKDQRVRLFGTCMPCTHHHHLTGNRTSAQWSAPRQLLVRWRGCVHDMHVPNSLIDTRSSSPREPAQVAAVGHESIFCEACSVLYLHMYETHDGACPISTCPNLSHKVGLQGREKVGHGGLKECVVNRFSPCPYFAGLFRALQAPCGIAIHYDPKTLIEMWIICLDPVSANSEKCIGCQWAVTPRRTDF